jgi:hypothetical protein
MAWNRELYSITTGTSPDYRIPVLDFKGSPVGIDIRKVVQTGITPLIDSAIAHKDPGYPNMGAGFVRAPLACFEKAVDAFAQKYGRLQLESEAATLPS